MRNIPQRTFPRNRLLSVYIVNNHIKFDFWILVFLYNSNIKVSPSSFTFLKNVENKDDFWSVSVSLSPRKPSL